MATQTKADRFTQLCAEFPLRPIRSEEHFDRAVACAESIDQGDLTADEEDYLEVLLGLIDTYQDARGHRLAGPRPTPGAMLKYLIEDAKRVSQAEVAKATGISESTISGMINEKRPISAKHIPVLAQYFGVGPGTFLAAAGGER